MKRWGLLLMCGALVLSMAGCGAKTDGPSPTGEATTTAADAVADTTTTASTTPAPAKLSDADKIQYNTEIGERLSHSIWKLVDLEQAEPVDYLATPENRSIFAWQIVLLHKEIDKQRDIDADGEEVTGAVSVAAKDYATVYSDLFHESPDLDALLRGNPYFQMKDDRIFGTYVTGWGAPDYALKTTDFVYNSDTGCYEVVMDVLTSFHDEVINGELMRHRVDWERVTEYDNASILTYPDDMIYATLTIGLEKSDQTYSFKYLWYTPQK